MKKSALSLVPPPPEEAKADSLNDFFDGWLNSVSPAVLKVSNELTAQTTYAQPRLTSTDVTRVNHATVRESSEHRHWPPDVVEKFMLADVIKRTRT